VQGGQLADAGAGAVEELQQQRVPVGDQRLQPAAGEELQRLPDQDLDLRLGQKFRQDFFPSGQGEAGAGVWGRIAPGLPEAEEGADGRDPGVQRRLPVIVLELDHPLPDMIGLDLLPGAAEPVLPEVVAELAQGFLIGEPGVGREAALVREEIEKGVEVQVIPNGDPVTGFARPAGARGAAFFEKT